MTQYTSIDVVNGKRHAALAGVSDRLELALFTIHHRILAEAAATSVASSPR